MIWVYVIVLKFLILLLLPRKVRRLCNTRFHTSVLPDEPRYLSGETESSSRFPLCPNLPFVPRPNTSPDFWSLVSRSGDVPDVLFVIVQGITPFLLLIYDDHGTGIEEQDDLKFQETNVLTRPGVYKVSRLWVCTKS